MTGVSTLAQTLGQIKQLKMQGSTMNQLTTSLTTGLKSQDYAGLGTKVLSTQRARAEIGALGTYVENISVAESRVKTMLSTLDQIKKQASNLVNTMNLNMQEGADPDFGTVRKMADNIFNLMQDVVNEKDGDRYILSGADSRTKPLADNGLMATYLGEFVPDESDYSAPPLTASGVIGSWGDGSMTTDQFISSYRGVSDSLLGYSESLAAGTAGKVTVRVDETAELDYTVLANTTGVRDVLVAVNVLRSMPPVSHAPGAMNDPNATTLDTDTPPTPPAEKQENYFKVLNDLSKMINGAIQDINVQSANLAQVQSQAASIRDGHKTDIITFQDVVGDAEEADMTETAAKITQLQIQIQASYQVTAMMSELSLARYMSG